MAQDWLATLMSGVGGAFTGYGAARDRRMTEAERARQAQRQQQQDALGAFSTQLEQRAALDQLGYRPSATLAPPRSGGYVSVEPNAERGTSGRGGMMAGAQGVGRSGIGEGSDIASAVTPRMLEQIARSTQSYPTQLDGERTLAGMQTSTRNGASSPQSLARIAEALRSRNTTETTPSLSMSRGFAGRATLPGIANSVPVDEIVSFARRGETITTPQGESFTLDRLATPDARRMRDTQMKQAEARAELDRRMQERLQGQAFESSEAEKARKHQAAMEAERRKRGMSDAQSNTAANLLAARYDADPIVKNAKDVAQSYGRILATEDSAAGDLSLIFAYMKMLDPGSVVREGEFANAQNAAGVPDIIRNSYNRAATGERLNPNQRVQFRAQAKALADQQRRALQQTRQRYSQRAVPYGIDPDLLFSDPFDLFDAVGGQANAPAGQRPPNSPDDY